VSYRKLLLLSLYSYFCAVWLFSAGFGDRCSCLEERRNAYSKHIR